MRTTINVDDNLLMQAKREAVLQKKSLGKLVEDALRSFFAERQRKESSAVISLVTCAGAGLKPGVNLDDGRSLLEIMDE